MANELFLWASNYANDCFWNETYHPPIPQKTGSMPSSVNTFLFDIALIWAHLSALLPSIHAYKWWRFWAFPFKSVTHSSHVMYAWEMTVKNCLPFVFYSSTTLNVFTKIKAHIKAQCIWVTVFSFSQSIDRRKRQPLHSDKTKVLGTLINSISVKAKIQCMWNIVWSNQINQCN